MPLELGSLQKAVSALEALVQKAEDTSLTDSIDPVLLDGIKSGVIQHFEFTYELCWKLLRRWLEINGEKHTMLGITQRELFRYGAENGLIDDPRAWWRFHESRNRTSHTYDVEIADEVYLAAVEFVSYAKSLYSKLEEHND